MHDCEVCDLATTDPWKTCYPCLRRRNIEALDRYVVRRRGL